MIPSVGILMATYNGEPFLRDQIGSLLKQTYAEWKLFVRDDGSQDGTTDIVEEYARTYPERIEVIPNTEGRLGAGQNFSRLLEATESKYFMFCDQDDVWLPRKIESTLQCMRKLEASSGEDVPLLVYTDLKAVDRDLRVLDDSYWHFGYHNPDYGKRLNRLLVQNMVAGCTIMMNKPLRDLVTPIPDGVAQYDWWAALVAVCLGRIDYVREPTILYRLHGGNTIGAIPWGITYVIGKLVNLFEGGGSLWSLQSSQEQAATLLARYGPRLRPADREILEAYASIGQQRFLARRLRLLRYGFFKTGWVRNAGLLVRV